MKGLIEINSQTLTQKTYNVKDEDGNPILYLEFDDYGRLVYLVQGNDDYQATYEYLEDGTVVMNEG